MARTLFDKVWDAHVVQSRDGYPHIIYIDLHLLHELTSPVAFEVLRQRGLKVRRPDRTIGTVDHSTPTRPGGFDIIDDECKAVIRQMAINCREAGITLYEMGDRRNGIVHVIGPERGHTQPGMTIVCGDSHTSTHGAFGALAFGIGTSEVGHVLATQCLLQYRPEPMEVRFEGMPRAGVGAKDLVLAVTGRLGIGGGTGCVFEFRGPAIEAMDMDGRMTVCNMSIEAGARGGMVAPDDTTFQYMAGREHAPKGADWDAAVARWRELHTDVGASFARSLTIDAASLEPMITWGTNPGMAAPVTRAVPTPEAAESAEERAALEKAIRYMDIEPGKPLLGKKIDVVFVGSCTNSRIADIRQAAEVLKGRKVAESVQMLVVPGSHEVKAQAEAEGLDQVFRAAGAEWREPGCSMCIAMNGDMLERGQYAVSTSNRNFEGRQGPGSRTFLASPMTAAACAVTGAIADVRPMLET